MLLHLHICTLSLHDALPILWASRIGLDILDVPRLTSKEKEACDRVGIDIGSVDIGNPGLLSVDSNKRKTAVQEMKKQRSDEHTSELQSRGHLVCSLLLEKKK